MKFSYKIKDKKAVISVLLMCVSIALGAIFCVKVIDMFRSFAEAKELVNKVVSCSKSDPNKIGEYFARDKGIAEELKKKNLFAETPKRENPVKEVNGILGSETLIGGKWYKQGDKIADAEIVLIGPAEVKVKWDGKTTSFSPIMASSSPAAGGEVRKEEPRRPGRMRGNFERRREEVREEVKPAAEADEFAWMGVKMSTALKAKFLEKWNKMSDEEKQKAKEGWSKMSDEQKQQMVDVMEKNIDRM